MSTPGDQSKNGVSQDFPGFGSAGNGLSLRRYNESRATASSRKSPTRLQPSLLRTTNTPAATNFQIVIPSSNSPFSTASSRLPDLNPYNDTSGSDRSNMSSPRRGRPSQSTLSKSADGSSMTPRMSLTSNTRQDTQSTGTSQKKRGRPFANPEAAARAAAKEQGPKKRGRPFKTPQPEPEAELLEPKFLVFYCEWKGCPAELHNLEALRNHVLKWSKHGHKNPSAARVCLWSKCGTPHEVFDAVTQERRVEYERFEFPSKKEWRDHVHEEHLLPVAWHMGDGPTSTKLDPEETDPRKKEPWLYGASGEQVTPSVKDLPVEEGNALRNNAKRFRKVRYGLNVVLEAIENPDDYLELDDFGENMKGLGDRIDDL